MLPLQILLVLLGCAFVGTAILENVDEADLNAVRIRLEDEKAKRLLLENDVEVLMIKVEELKRNFSSGTKVSAFPRNVTSSTAGIAFTATLSKQTTYVSAQTVIFDNVKLNEGNCYNSSTGQFSSPFRGLYIFSVTILKMSDLDKHVNLYIMKDNHEIGRLFSGITLNDSGSITVVTVMEKGQVAYVRPMHDSPVTIYGDYYAHFTGILHMQYN